MATPVAIVSTQLDRAIKKIEKGIPEMIRVRLWAKGTYADGVKIHTYKAQRPNVYAHRTIGLKRLAGAPTNRVTLKHSGSFYASIKVVNHQLRADTSYVDENVDAERALGITDAQAEEIERQTEEAVEHAVAKMDDIELA